MMIKSALYLSLYGAIAGAGWFFYQSLDNNEEPIAQLQESYQELKTNLQTDAPTSGLYRWKNADGVWEYGDKLPDHLQSNMSEAQKNYQKELELLKQLPKEALPIKDNTLENEASASNFGRSFTIPGIPSLDQVSKLLDNATDIQGKLDKRQQEIDKVLEN